MRQWEWTCLETNVFHDKNETMEGTQVDVQRIHAEVASRSKTSSVHQKASEVTPPHLFSPGRSYLVISSPFDTSLNARNPADEMIESFAPTLSQPEFDLSRVPATTQPLVATPPALACELCVAIPVHNEEAEIVETLEALASQIDLEGHPLDPSRYEILVLANNCSDLTGVIVRSFAVAHPQLRLHLIEVLLEPPHRHVGAARRLVMDEACRRLEGLGKARGVIATTDGDTRVRPNWVVANLAEIRAGADAVGGRILSEPTQIEALMPGTRLYYRLDTTYRTLRAAYESVLDPRPGNPWPRHHHCFGASLAVTTESYRAAGGLPALPCLEDMAFTDALERLNARIRQSPAVNVLTSLRVAGRVEVGLSGTLSKWTQAATAGEPLLLESPDTIEQEARAGHHLRQWWQKGFSEANVSSAAGQLKVDADWLAECWQQASSAGELCQRVRWHHREAHTGPHALPLMEVRQAIAGLRERLAGQRGALRAATVPLPGLSGRTGRGGTALPDGLSGAPTARPARWLPRRSWHVPDRPSAGIPAPTASSAPAATGRPRPVS